MAKKKAAAKTTAPKRNNKPSAAELVSLLEDVEACREDLAACVLAYNDALEAAKVEA